MLPKIKLSACCAVALALPLSGCGVLASNGLDYSTYPIPALPAAPTPVAMPAAPPCQMPESGQPVSLDGCKTGDTIVLRGVNFDFNKATLTVNAKALLDQVASALTARPDIKVEVDGHTDGKGTDAYNQKLSEARASAVKAYLVQHAIAATRLSTHGYGKTVPVADNATDEGRELNRRVELKVIESAMPAMPVAAAAAPAPGIDHSAIVVLEPVPSFLQEPGAGLPTSVGVLTTVPRPIESGPTTVTSQRALPADYAGKHASMVGYPGSSFPAAAAPAAAPAAMPAPAAAIAGADTVAISGYAFVPATLTVSKGSTVSWTNRDPSPHTVKFPDQDHTISPGGSFSRTFDKAGVYVYQCGIHTAMQGKIVVQ